MPSNAISIDQIKINADGSFKGLDEVRLYNGTDVLHCKEGFSQGILGTSSTGWKMVSVTWNNGVPAVNSTNAPVLGDSVDLNVNDLFPPAVNFTSDFYYKNGTFTFGYTSSAYGIYTSSTSWTSRSITSNTYYFYAPHLQTARSSVSSNRNEWSVNMTNLSIFYAPKLYNGAIYGYLSITNFGGEHLYLPTLHGASYLTLIGSAPNLKTIYIPEISRGIKTAIPSTFVTNYLDFILIGREQWELTYGGDNCCFHTKVLLLPNISTSYGLQGEGTFWYKNIQSLYIPNAISLDYIKGTCSFSISSLVLPKCNYLSISHFANNNTNLKSIYLLNSIRATIRDIGSYYTTVSIYVPSSVYNSYITTYSNYSTCFHSMTTQAVSSFLISYHAEYSSYLNFNPYKSIDAFFAKNL